MKRTFKRLFAALLCAIMVLSALPIAGFAAAKKNVYRDDSEYLIEKLSNPYTYSGEADGIVPGGDRENSYAWTIQRMTDEDGDYIYIGSNRNILYMGVGNVALSGETLDEDTIQAAIDLVSNGELVTSSNKREMLAAKVYRYNLKTGKTELFYDAADYPMLDENNLPTENGAILGFRSSVIFNGSLYINSAGAGKSVTWKVANNSSKTLEKVYSAPGSFMRAVTVSADGNTMYLGGTYKDNVNIEGIDYKFQVLKTTTGEAGSFMQIADYRDFMPYESEAYHTSGGDVWDMVEYGGSLYLTFMTTRGGIMYKGRVAHQEEMDSANDYGWIWEEIVGENSEIGAGFGNPMNYAFTPYIYKDDLYFLTFTNAMDAGIECLFQTYKAITQEDPDLDLYFESLRFMEAALDNETSIFRMVDGEFEMVLGDEDKCPDNIEFKAVLGAGFNDAEFSTTQYNWRAAIHNGKLYVGTFDAASYYKYFTKLTNGELFEMSTEEKRSQLEYLNEFIRIILAPKSSPSASEGALASEAGSESIAALAAAQYLAVYGETDEPSLSEAQNGPDSAPVGVNADTLKELVEVFEYILDNIDGETVTAVVSKILHSIKLADNGIEELRDKIEALRNSPLISDSDVIDMMLNIVDGVLHLFRNVDQADIDCYTNVSDVIAANNNFGFELYCTEDGINYKTVANDGFGDEYNYGARTLIAFDGENDSYAGVYLGTANPFYGCQLWKISEKDVNMDGATFSSNAITSPFKEDKHFYLGISFKKNFEFSFIPNDSNSTLYLNGRKLDSWSGSTPLKFGINFIRITTKNLSGSSNYTYVIICPNSLGNFLDFKK